MKNFADHKFFSSDNVFFIFLTQINCMYSGDSKLLYLAIMGEIFDVTRGEKVRILLIAFLKRAHNFFSAASMNSSTTARDSPTPILWAPMQVEHSLLESLTQKTENQMLSIMSYLYHRG